MFTIRHLVFIFIALCFMQPLRAQSEYYGDHFNEITDYLRNNYVDPVNVDSIIHSMVAAYLNDPETINTLFQKLDPHSNYLTAQEYTDLKEGLAGSFFGIGIAFTMHNDTAIITEVFDNGPAFNGGMQIGDRIMKINDTVMAGNGITSDDIFFKMRGPKGTTVKVSIMRDHAPKLNELTFVRDKIQLSSVEVAYMMTKQIGYIKLAWFGETTYDECVRALAELNKQGMKQLVLDLRDNTGGYLKSAVRIADEFLPGDKLVVYTQGYKQERKDYLTEKEGLFEKGDMVVLVNNETASSGEILTGALQDNKRAAIIGTRTYGKGLVQQLYALSDSLTALKLTTARYYTPSGRCIQRPYLEGSEIYHDEFQIASMHTGALPEIYKNDAWGIHPDVFVPEDTVSSTIVVQALSNRNYIQHAAYVYYADHRFEFAGFSDAHAFTTSYKINDVLFESFKTFAAAEEKKLEADQRILYTDADILAAQTQIETLLKAYLARERWGKEGMFVVLNMTDRDVAAALTQLKK